MEKTFATHRYYLHPLLVLLCLTLIGCATPHAADEPSVTVDEQAYLDFKLGFTLVVPVTWKREKIPVSSPLYRSDTVSWAIASSRKRIGQLRLQTLNETSELSHRETLSTFLNDQNELLHSNILEFDHPAGHALRLDGWNATNKVIYLIIKDKQNIYILAVEFAKEHGPEIIPLVENVFSSFSILPE